MNPSVHAFMQIHSKRYLFPSHPRPLQIWSLFVGHDFRNQILKKYGAQNIVVPAFDNVHVHRLHTSIDIFPMSIPPTMVVDDALDPRYDTLISEGSIHDAVFFELSR